MNEPADYDGAWKEALEVYLRPFLEFCFPVIAAGIDWTIPIEFLDQELQEIVRDSELGKQRVDKLVKVLRRDGTEEWLLVHVEIQAQPDPALPRRMYQYHHRIADRYGRPVVSLAVLADSQAGWRPGSYEKSKTMSYVTSIERLGREEGRQEGRQSALRESVLELLETRFGGLAVPVRDRVEAIQDETELKQLLRQAALVSSLAEFSQVIGLH